MGSETRLVAAHQAAVEDAIRRTCRRWRLRESEAADLSNHLWCVVLDNDARVIQRFQGRSAISTYLFPIMMRNARKWLERRARGRRLEVPMGDTYAVFAHLVPSDGGGDGDKTERQLARRLRQAVSSLRRVDRLLIRLRFDEGRSIGDIAAMLLISHKAVERRLARAIERLRSLMEIKKAATGRPPTRMRGQRRLTPASSSRSCGRSTKQVPWPAKPARISAAVR